MSPLRSSTENRANAPLPKWPKNKPFRPVIEHHDYNEWVMKDVEKLRRLVGYPSSKKTYKGSERLEAVLTCLKKLKKNKRDQLSRAIFAWCLYRDPRMSKKTRDFAGAAIRESMDMIQHNMELLDYHKRAWKREFETEKEQLLSYERENPRPKVRFYTILHLKKTIREYNEWFAKAKRQTFWEWPFNYEWDAFERRIRQELREFRWAFAVAQGLMPTPLPNDIKRNIFRRARGKSRGTSSGSNARRSGTSESNSSRSGSSMSWSNGN